MNNFSGRWKVLPEVSVSNFVLIFMGNSELYSGLQQTSKTEYFATNFYRTCL